MSPLLPSHRNLRMYNPPLHAQICTSLYTSGKYQEESEGLRSQYSGKMSHQEQLRRAEDEEEEEEDQQQEGGHEPIKYGDVFGVSGKLKDKPIAPGDAALMQSAEVKVLGQPQTGGPADAMQYAASQNLSAGLVGRLDVSDVARKEGVTVMETDVPGSRIVTEAVGCQVIGQFTQPVPLPRGVKGGDEYRAKITIGEVLQATANATGDKTIDQSDAAAIQAAEARATGTDVLTPGGIGATAQSAVAYNATVVRDEDKVKLFDVLQDASVKLPADKVATREDAERVMSAEMHYNPNLVMKPGGIAASVAAAARINERDTDAST